MWYIDRDLNIDIGMFVYEMFRKRVLNTTVRAIRMAKVQVYYGTGAGKTSAALGNAIKAVSNGASVIIIQFLKGMLDEDMIKRLEPEIRAFRFERASSCFCDLTEEEKAEEKQNILNGLNFAKKVLTTGECDVLVLDEVLGLVDEGLISEAELIEIMKCGFPSTQLIATGTRLSPGIREAADQVLQIVAEK